MCLVLTGCMRDVASLVIPVDLIEDTVKTAKYKTSGECVKLCDRDWWKTSTTRDLQNQLNAGSAVMGREQYKRRGRTLRGGKTPLHYAAKHGTPAHIKMLIGAGSKINAKDVNGRTPLHDAITNSANIKTLLNAGADHDARTNEYEYTPLHLAAVRGNPASIQVLLTVGGLHTRSATDDTPLTMTMETGIWPDDYNSVPVENMKVLVRAGADVNVMGGCDQTPLQLAAEYGNPIDVMYLLKMGANPNPKIEPSRICGKNYSPIELATQNKNLKGTKAFYVLRDATYK